MEELLNKLIERGWKPFPNEWIDCYYFKFSNRGHDLMCCSSDDDDEYTHNYTYSWRDIVSKESGLWQFVCENGMYKKEALGIIFNDERAKNVFYKIDQFDEEGDVIQTGDMGGDEFIHISEPEYRLIESALRDESELENFLLQNIKVGNED